MPGIIVFRRRWAVGSDDLVVPTLFVVVFHIVWLLGLSVSLVTLSDGGGGGLGVVVDSDDGGPDSANKSTANATTNPYGDFGTASCRGQFVSFVLLFIVLWTVAVFTEVTIATVSLRGTIYNDGERAAAEYLLYVRLVLWLIEIALSSVCVVWLCENYVARCEGLSTAHKNVILALVISNAVMFVVGVMILWCSFDVAGRDWVKLKKYQKSLKNQKEHHDKSPDHKGRNKVRMKAYKRSGSNPSRSWRHRKVRRAYQSSWNSRCQVLFCCVKMSKGKNESSFSDIARVLSEFFRDLDVVPTDVIVGLVLLRHRQQLIRMRVVDLPTNPVYQFLSGVRVTPDTRFLSPNTDAEDAHVVRELYHYMHFAIGVYGWPMYFRKESNNTLLAACRLCSSLRCSSSRCPTASSFSKSVHDGSDVATEVIEDNCCACNVAAYGAFMDDLPNVQLVYITYHVDVGETPFLVAVDFEWRTIVVSIRGTLSLKDLMTDLNAESEPLPIRPVKEDWMGHKGIVDAAAYVHRRLKEEDLLGRAFNLTKETRDFDVVCVGHSLGAGAAAILAIMLRQEFPRTRAFSFSPPGGTLSASAMEHSREFVTSCIVGKDIIPRVGLHQLETLRHNLIQALHESQEAKWMTLYSSMKCCGGRGDGDARNPFSHDDHGWAEYESRMISALAAGVAGGFANRSKPDTPAAQDPAAKRRSSGAEDDDAAAINILPWDSSVNLSVHQPLYPPGKIVHLVRDYPKPQEDGSEKKGGTFGAIYKRPSNADPELKAVWADNRNFDEVLISKRMIKDHMPDTVLESLAKVVNSVTSHQTKKSRSGDDDVVIVTDETKVNVNDKKEEEDRNQEQSLMTTFAQIDCSNGSPRSSPTSLAKCVDLPKVVPPSSSTRTADGERDLNAAADQRKGERDSRSEFVLHSEL